MKRSMLEKNQSLGPVDREIRPAVLAPSSLTHWVDCPSYPNAPTDYPGAVPLGSPGNIYSMLRSNSSNHPVDSKSGSYA